MQKQQYTILIFLGEGTPSKFQISKLVVRTLLFTFLALFIGFTGSSFYFTSNYTQMLDDTAELIELRRETKLQKIKVEKFYDS